MNELIDTLLTVILMCAALTPMLVVAALVKYLIG